MVPSVDSLSIGLGQLGCVLMHSNCFSFIFVTDNFTNRTLVTSEVNTSTGSVRVSDFMPLVNLDVLSSNIY